MRLLLIRHGETGSNVRHALDTALPGADLTDRGRTQAAALPRTLHGVHLDSVWSSPAARAMQTAEPLALSRRLIVQTLGGMHEIQAGDLEMRSDRESLTAYIDVMRAWSAGELDTRVPGGESGREALQRMFDSVRQVADRASTAAIVSHGAAMRLWTGYVARNIRPDFVIHHGIDNTGVLVLEGDPDAGWQLISWEGELIHARGVSARRTEDAEAANPFGTSSHDTV